MRWLLPVSSMAFAAWTAAGPAVSAPPPAGLRVELPVRETDYGPVRRYSVPITLGGTTVQAMIDTGSTGLRVLPDTLDKADVKEGLLGAAVKYASGIELRGPKAQATLRLGSLSGLTTIQSVHAIACFLPAARCPSADKLKAYRFAGDGQSDTDLKVILGISMVNADIPNPIIGIGVRRWIIELPRPGESAPGRLVLNPTDEEVKDYAAIPLVPHLKTTEGGVHDAVEGCILNTVTQAKACGPMILDSGTPNVAVMNSDLKPATWTTGQFALLGFYDKTGAMEAVEQFRIGDNDQGGRLAFGHGMLSEPFMVTGLTSYFAFSVLYDPAGNSVGVRPRPPSPTGPIGELHRPSAPARH